MREKLKGIIVPAVTPFDEAGDLRLDWLKSNLLRWNGTQVRGVMVLGTNGEFRSLNDAEARLVIECAAGLMEGKTLIAGVGRESTRLTLDFIESLSEFASAVDYVSVLPPHYFAKVMSPSALTEYYTEVADHSPIPVLVYVAPGYANGLVVPPAVVASLAEHPNIAGIKDTSTDQMTSYMVAAGGREDFSILAGSLNTLMTCLMFGGSGGVVSAANYFPNDCAEIPRLYAAGRVEEAIAAFHRLQHLVKMTGGRHGVASVKACMNLLGYEAGVPRRPLQPADEAATEAIRAALDADPYLGAV